MAGTKNDEGASWKKRSTPQIRRRHQSIVFILLTLPRALNFGRAHADPVWTALPPALTMSHQNKHRSIICIASFTSAGVGME